MSSIKIPVMATVEALPYPDILRIVQEAMSRQSTELGQKENLTEQEAFLFKQIIEACLKDQQIAYAELTIPDLVERLYRDMKEYSFLTPYVKQEAIDELGLEEIRVNSWESVFLITKKHGKIRLKEKFLSPTHALDIVKRLLQKSNMTLDHTSPAALGHLGKTQRVAAFQAPILDAETGVCANIRIVSFSKLTRDNLIGWKTATADMLDFLLLCIRYGISLCVSGRTGCGKTGTLGYLLSEISKDDTYRIVTLEEGSREFDLVRRDENGMVINDVIHMLTRLSDDPKANITLDKLLALNMRNSPDIMAIGEMRSEEAFTAIEAAYTDHTIITTTHAVSARYTYKRMAMLAAKGTGAFSEDKLFEYAIEAFPIIVYQKQMPDGTRRISRIYEGTGYENGRIQGQRLYEFKVERTEIGDDGKPITMGQFRKCNNMSEALRQRLIDAGAPDLELARFLREDGK